MNLPRPLILSAIALAVFSCVPADGQKKSPIDGENRQTILGQLNDGSENPQSRYPLFPTVKKVIKGANGSAVDNLSAIIFLPATNTFLGIRNKDKYLHEMDANFKVIRDIPIRISGAESDLEGLAYLGEGSDGPEVAMVNEAAELFIGVIPRGVKSIDRKNFKKLIVSRGSYGNEGPEGLAYDQLTGTFYVGFEGAGDSESTRLVKFTRPALITDGMDVSHLVSEPFDIFQATHMGDLADLALDPLTGHILALSEVDRVLYELDDRGVLYGHHVLDKSEQHEGVIVRPDNGQLVLAAEPNVIHAYDRLSE